MGKIIILHTKMLQTSRALATRFPIVADDIKEIPSQGTDNMSEKRT